MTQNINIDSLLNANAFKNNTLVVFFFSVDTHSYFQKQIVRNYNELPESSLLAPVMVDDSKDLFGESLQ